MFEASGLLQHSTDTIERDLGCIRERTSCAAFVMLSGLQRLGKVSDGGNSTITYCRVTARLSSSRDGRRGAEVVANPACESKIRGSIPDFPLWPCQYDKAIITCVNEFWELYAVQSEGSDRFVGPHTVGILAAGTPSDTTSLLIRTAWRPEREL